MGESSAPSRVISINGVDFTKQPGAAYAHDYYRIVDDIERGVLREADAYGNLVLEDLWFIVYFVMKVPGANHPFVVKACRDVENGPDSHTLDIWARGHYKSTIRTARLIQRILTNPEIRVLILSYKKEAAIAFLRQVKLLFEKSEFLKYLFNDVLYQDPIREADKWSEEAGLYVRRQSSAKEPTLFAAGLIDSMPTGGHYTDIEYDDIMVLEMAESPHMIEKVKERFAMSLNLRSEGTRVSIWGTPYDNGDVIMHIKDLRGPDGQPIYTTRMKPATVGGEPNGAAVFKSEKELAELRTNPRVFYSQQLLNPTPPGTQKLNASFIRTVQPKEIPQKLVKLMAIDPAGVNKNRPGDSWAMLVVGVRPFIDDLGASDFYILDAIVEPMEHDQAIKTAVNMYTRNGRIMKLGVEKVAMSTTEIHLSKALRARGRVVTIENEGLVLLRPAGRDKQYRIESNLSWPLNNGKIHISAGIPAAYRERLRLEMEKFPFYAHDDALDALSYIVDMTKDYRFGREAFEDPDVDPWDDDDDEPRRTWITV